MIKRVFWATLLLTFSVTACSNANTAPPEFEFTLAPTLVIENTPEIVETPPAYLPQIGDNNLNRANAIISSVYVLFSNTDPNEILLHISGYLPTPCHELRVSIPDPDENGDIFVEVYALTEPNLECEQVLRAYDVSVNLGTFPVGSYWVWVNGGKAGNFDF